MTLNEDRADKAIVALSLVLRAIHSRKTEQKGEGTITCPACEKTMKFAFVRRPSQSRRLGVTYVGECETEGCITFRGH